MFGDFFNRFYIKALILSLVSLFINFFVFSMENQDQTKLEKGRPSFLFVPSEIGLQENNLVSTYPLPDRELGFFEMSLKKMEEENKHLYLRFKQLLKEGRYPEILRNKNLVDLLIELGLAFESRIGDEVVLDMRILWFMFNDENLAKPKFGSLFEEDEDFIKSEFYGLDD